MKKTILFAVVLLLALSPLIFANRAAIDEVIAAYEQVVVEAEAVAELALIGTNDFAELEGKAEAAGPKVLAIQAEKEWAIRDAIKLAELNGRFNKAMTIIAKKLLQY